MQKSGEKTLTVNTPAPITIPVHTTRRIITHIVNHSSFHITMSTAMTIEAAAAEKRKELLSNFPPSTSQRFACLETVVNKALQASVQQFDVEQAMVQVYGAEDVESFGKDTLRVFFDSALNKINQHTVQRLQAYSAAQDLPAKLSHLEAAAEKFVREAAWAQFWHEQDQAAAQTALLAAKLPAGYQTADDVVRAHLYQQLVTQTTALQEELEALERENAELRAQQSRHEQVFRQHRPNVEQLASEMEKAADVTSAITK
jgi:hypothetical protein